MVGFGWSRSANRELRVHAVREQSPLWDGSNWGAAFMAGLLGGVVFQTWIAFFGGMLLVLLIAISRDPDVLIYQPWRGEVRLRGPLGRYRAPVDEFRSVRLVPAGRHRERIEFSTSKVASVPLIETESGRAMSVAWAIARDTGLPIDDWSRQRQVRTDQLNQPMYQHAHPMAAPGEVPEWVQVGDPHSFTVGFPPPWLPPLLGFLVLTVASSFATSDEAWVAIFVPGFLLALAAYVVLAANATVVQLTPDRLWIGNHQLPRRSIIAVEPARNGVVVLLAGGSFRRIRCIGEPMREWVGRMVTAWACEPPTV